MANFVTCLFFIYIEVAVHPGEKAVQAASTPLCRGGIGAPGLGRRGDALVEGSWCSGNAPAGDAFDTVLCDYLIGSMDGFTPFMQDTILAELKARSGSSFVGVAALGWRGRSAESAAPARSKSYYPPIRRRSGESY